MGSTVKQPPTKKAPVRRPRRRLFLIALLVGLTGFGAYGAARHLWAEYHFRAAQKELERHALPAAKSHLAECLAIWPDSTETNLLAARTARRLRDYDEADQLLSIYRKQGGEPEIVRLEHALALAQRGQLAGQESYLWVFVNEGDPDAALVLEALDQG